MSRNRLLPLCILAAVLISAAPAGAQSIADLLAAGQTDKLRDRMVPGVQGEAAFNSFVGRLDLNASLKGLPRGAVNCEEGPARVQLARDWLVSNAATARVLMFNENHLVPAARVFVRGVLPQLRSLGFTHIGFETFVVKDEIARAPGPADGYYSVEPTFSALLREARAQGFTIFGYEPRMLSPPASPEERIALREQGQADNLQRVIREAPAGSRFVVYAGHGHIRESPVLTHDGKTQLWMAARFREQSGIDPLTIDLTGCDYPVSSGSGEGGRVRLGEDNKVRVDGQLRGAVDAQFVLPAPSPEHKDLAGFYRSTLGRPVDVPKRLQPRGATVLVEARAVGAPPGDVALDRVLLRPDERLPLYLPPGAYQLTAHRADGTRVGEARVKVR